MIQELQRAYARREVDRVLALDLGRRVGSRQYKSVRAYLGASLKGKTLFFGMWTNNPRATYRHLKIAIDRLGAQLGGVDPAVWPAGAGDRLADQFERVLRRLAVRLLGRRQGPRGRAHQPHRQDPRGHRAGAAGSRVDRRTHQARVLGEAAAPGLEASERYDGALLGEILDEPPPVWHQ